MLPILGPRETLLLSPGPGSLGAAGQPASHGSVLPDSVSTRHPPLPAQATWAPAQWNKDPCGGEDTRSGGHARQQGHVPCQLTGGGVLPQRYLAILTPEPFRTQVT